MIDLTELARVQVNAVSPGLIETGFSVLGRGFATGVERSGSAALLPLSARLVLFAFTRALPIAAWTFDGRRAVIIDGDTLALKTERVRLINCSGHGA